MCAYKIDIEREIKAAELKHEELVEEFNRAGGTSAPNFFDLFSNIQSQRQTIAAKKERLNAIGKQRKDFPDFVNLNQYKKA